MIWLHDALFAIVLAGAQVGRRVGHSVFGDSRLPGWLDRYLDWNQASDEDRARQAERDHHEPPRGKDAGADW